MRSAAGGCHCASVRFEADIPDDAVLLDCNCSICTMTGFLHLIVPAPAFRLLTGQQFLTTYRFGTGTALHHFCRICGVKSFYRPRSHPDGVSLNARALDGGIPDLPIRSFDGRNWEAARLALGE